MTLVADTNVLIELFLPGASARWFSTAGIMIRTGAFQPCEFLKSGMCC